VQAVAIQQQDLVLVGGGHAHVLALRMLAMQPIPGVRITLVSPASHTPYSGMLPGLVAGHYRFEETHIDLARLCQWAGVRFVESSVVALDPDQRLISIAGRPPLAYDLLSLDIGSQPELDSVPGAREHAVPVKPVAGLWQNWQRWLAQIDGQEARVAVVGGGAGSVELVMAMATCLAGRKLQFALYCGAADILPEYSRGARAAVRRGLDALGIDVHCNARVAAVDQRSLQFESGREPAQYDRLFWCTGAVAAPWIAESGLATDDRGFLLIRDTLQALDDESIFAAGDIAVQVNHPRPRAGVFAVRQAPVLAHNLRCRLLSLPLKNHRPQRRFLSLLSLGGKRAVADKHGFAASGDWVWHWKDRIDRRFMALFESLPPMPSAPENALPSGEAVQAPCGGCGAKVGGDSLRAALATLSDRYPQHCPRSVSSDDAAIVSSHGPIMQSVDVLRAMVGDPWLMGRIAANHALSDLYAVAARPLSALAVITLPFASETLLQRELQQVLAGALHELSAVDCVLLGGHSMQGQELSVGFVVNGQAAAEDQVLLPKQGLQPGDQLVLCKPLGSGALFAAHMQLKADGRDLTAAIDNMLKSNFAAGQLAVEHQASAATDITGFGLAGHLREMLAPGRGAQLHSESIPALAGAMAALSEGVTSTMQDSNRAAAGRLDYGNTADKAVVELLFDPQTSGGLLIGIAQPRVEELCRSLRSAGYPDAAVIGAVTQSATGEIHVS
jgi:selenide, water dikinase